MQALDVRLPKVDDTYMKGVMRAFPTISLDTAKPVSHLPASYSQGIDHYKQETAYNVNLDASYHPDDPLGQPPISLRELEHYLMSDKPAEAKREALDDFGQVHGFLPYGNETLRGLARGVGEEPIYLGDRNEVRNQVKTDMRGIKEQYGRLFGIAPYFSDVVVGEEDLPTEFLYIREIQFDGQRLRMPMGRVSGVLNSSEINEQARFEETIPVEVYKIIPVEGGNIVLPLGKGSVKNELLPLGQVGGAYDDATSRLYIDPSALPYSNKRRWLVSYRDTHGIELEPLTLEEVSPHELEHTGQHRLGSIKRKERLYMGSAKPLIEAEATWLHKNLRGNAREYPDLLPMYESRIDTLTRKFGSREAAAKAAFFETEPLDLEGKLPETYSAN